VSTKLLDAWLEVGGNVLDTAREYGASESIIGRWMEERGCRDDVVVVTKCAHPENGASRLAPPEIVRDLEESLDALRTSQIDILLLHRDDPREPVGRVLEVLNEQREAGRIGAFGASNWTTARLDEAATYARSHGLEPFACSSANLSLAAQNEPAWPGTSSVSDAASRAWYERTGVPLFAWSAQAAGFFARGESALADPDVARVYGSPGNAERLRRAQALGRTKGADANAVALAWVLAQPFPVYAIVGPQSVAELRSTVAAVEVSLTAEDVRWLALETVAAPVVA
jgi:aryl-alcohol dehydrogenase-like predicted oxidoreductase